MTLEMKNMIGTYACLNACVLSCFNYVQLFETLWTVPARLLCPWDSPGKNMGVGCHFLLQENPPDLGIRPASLVSPALAGGFLPGKPYALLGTVKLL